MALPRIRKIGPMLAAVAFVSALLLLAAESADAASALFRAKRTWWFGHTSSWTDGHVEPRTGKGSYQPPAIAGVGSTATHPAFTAPKSFIKNTTYVWSCGPPGNKCYVGYPETKTWKSYWNAKGSFRPNNPYGAATTTTVRMRTTADGYDPSLMGWPGVKRIVPTAMGQFVRTVTVASPPPTAMGNPLTPTATWGGRYDHSRGGSIMIWPGKNRFGGTMRFFEGPNSRYFMWTVYRPGYDYSYSFTIRAKPLSKQIETGVEIAIGEVTESAVGFKYKLTTGGTYRHRLIIGTTSMGGPEYYVRIAHYLITRAPYTTGMVQIWEPNGFTNTIHTATGYDNRTAAGLNGNISLVHPRLVHTYVVPPPTSRKPIRAFWSAARLRKIDFRFLPEPAGIAMLMSGLATLAGLYRLRRW